MSTVTSLSSNPPWWRRCLRFFLGFEPMYHAWWEILLMRSGIAYVAWQTMSGHSPFKSQPTPHGFATWGLDFSWIGNEALSHYLIPFWGLCLFLYALGCVPSLSLLPPLIASIAHGTLGNSQGGIGHTTQIVTAVLLAAWLASIWSLFCAKTRRRLPHGFTPAQLELDWSRQVITATYVASAITKCLESEGGWLSDTPYFALQIVKATESAYYNYLIPADNAAWLAQALVDHPTLAKLLIGAALPLEMFAFLGLLNRRSALFFGLALIGFHSSVTEVMNLGFVYHKSLLLFLFVNPVWWALLPINKWRLRFNVEAPPAWWQRFAIVNLFCLWATNGGGHQTILSATQNPNSIIQALWSAFSQDIYTGLNALGRLIVEGLGDWKLCPLSALLLLIFYAASRNAPKVRTWTFYFLLTVAVSVILKVMVHLF